MEFLDFECEPCAVGVDLPRYRNDGLDVGVQRTPTFFLNGARYDGALTYVAPKTTLDQALAA